MDEGLRRLDVANFVSHGITKEPGPLGNPGEARPDAIADDVAGGTDVQVVLYNDDFTPMEFVARVLQE